MTLKNSYQKLMDTICVTPEMESRILDNIQREIASGQDRKKNRVVILQRYARRILPIAACFAVVIMAVWAAVSAKVPPIQGSNPLTAYDTQEQLEEALPFSLKLPNTLPEGYVPSSYCVILGSTAQIDYQNSAGDLLSFRMVPYTEEYRQFLENSAAPSNKTTLENGGTKYQLQGDGKNFSLIWWSDGEYLYAIQASTPQKADALIQTARSVG